MRGHGAGSFEALRVINGRFEGQCGNRPDARNRHHPHADLILGRCTFDSPIQVQKVLIQDQPRVQQRQQRIGEDIINLDHWSNDIVKAAMLHGLRQADAKDLQRAPHFVGQINRLAEQCLTGAEQSTLTMRLPALHMNRAEPSRTEHLGDPARVCPIRLVAHRRQRCVDLAGLHTNDIKAFFLETEEKVLAHRTRFKANPFDGVRECNQARRNVTNLTRQLALKQHPSLAINNAQRTRPQRHIQTNKVFHHLSPLFTDIL
jgi:hypothetical protein